MKYVNLPVTTSLKLSLDDFEWLQQVSERARRPQAEILREALRRFRETSEVSEINALP